MYDDDLVKTVKTEQNCALDAVNSLQPNLHFTAEEGHSEKN